MKELLRQIALRLYPAGSPTQRRWLILTLGLFLAAGVVAFIGYRATVWPLRRALPWSASNIREYKWSAGFLPDYIYYLRADIPRKEFHAYVQRVGLAPYDESKDPHHYTWSWSDPQAPGWWTPSRTANMVYFRVYPDGGTYAKYEGGKVYVFSFDM